MNGALEQFNSKKISGWLSFKDNESNVLYYSIGSDERKPLPLVKGNRKDIKKKHFTFNINVNLDDCTTIKIQNEGGINVLGTPKKIIASSEEKSKVMKGHNGWLYLSNDTNNYMEYFLGNIGINADVLNNWIVQENSRKMVCSFSKIEYFSFIVPEKCSVYPEFLPSEFFKKRSALIEDLEKIPVISNMFIPSFPKDTALYDKYDPDDYFYYKGDTHWNYFGAYHAFTQIMQKLNVSPIVSLDKFVVNKSYTSGDLINKLDAVNIELARHVKVRKNSAIEVFNNNMLKTGRVECYINESALTNKKLVIFHTSSIDWMKPFILAQFRSVTFVWSKRIDWNIVKEYNPDTLIYQTNERFMTSSAKDISLNSLGYTNNYIANKLIECNCESFSVFNRDVYDFLTSDYSECIKKSPLKIILKAKNETELIDAWIDHHAQIVGYDNIIIVDTGSDDPKYINKLEYYKDRVLILNYSKPYNLIHANKSKANKAFYDLIEKTSDRMIILDADEFMLFYNGGRFSKNFDSTKYDNDIILCGTWMNNASLPDGDVFSLKEKSISFYVDDKKIRHGTKAGKSIVPTMLLNNLDHIGHNFHSQKNIDYINGKSLGDVFIFHFSNLGEKLTKKRVAAHLLSLGIDDQLLLNSNNGKELIERIEVDNPNTRLLNYIKQYFERHNFEHGEVISLNLHNPENSDFNSGVDLLSKNIVNLYSSLMSEIKKGS
ncbi:glycosyltransferase family 2 protein [Vibrio alfacsensis]|uniref:glycosyltransferase family 2 protein n=1 Tax=Vibrio alfacsensis TaxID=1074311 RepID=UPI004068F8D0